MRALNIFQQNSFTLMGYQSVITLVEWKPSLILSSFAAAASALIIILHVVFNWLVRIFSGTTMEQSRKDGDSGGFVARHGNLQILFFMTGRALGCLALLSLSVWSAVTRYRTSEDASAELLICTTYLYLSILAVTSILIPRSSIICGRHVTVLLLVTFSIYAYRDIWPFATYTQVPIDIAEGPVLWAKVAILFVISILIPLLVPRRYVPIDINNPADPPNPEQTAPLLSLMLYTFLDPIILKAYKLPHLSHNLLPQLVDDDRSEILTGKAFPHLDTFSGAKKRHLFFGLMRVYRFEYTVLALTVIGQCISEFASPIAINRILNYLEKNGIGATIKPWFWISLLFLGPMVHTLSFQWYIFIATRTLVRTEGLLTQLVFEHSLRIRLKAEVPKSSGENEGTPKPSGQNTVASTPDNASTKSGKSGGSDQATPTLASSSSTQLPQSSASSTKGKKKAEPTSSDAQPEKKPSSDNLIGKINNLVTTDLQNIVDARDFLLVGLYVPIQVVLSIIFLHNVLGWSAFVGLGFLVLLTPVPGLIAKKVQDIQTKKMKLTDARVQTVSEMMNTLRMIKLFGWEERMSGIIREKREEELVLLWQRKLWDLVLQLSNFVVPTLTMLVTYTVYTVIMKEEMSASKVFSSMTVFAMMRGYLSRIFFQLTATIQGKVSLDRVNEFLHDTELLDSFSTKEKDDVALSIDTHDKDTIGFNDATFSWSTEPEEDMAPSDRPFKLRIMGELTFKRDTINLVIGPTGSGKTSLLMALLGEMHYLPINSESSFSLPRGGGVAYAAQESWVQNATIKENIVFGGAFDEVRYKKVIHQCALERDLTMFEAGDETEVGERGLTLSGGQKARVTLARAIYSSAEILLLDDVLAALDVHTSRWIVNKCFQGDLVCGRTIILVTHNITLNSIAGFVVTLDLDGNACAQPEDLNISTHLTGWDNDDEIATELDAAGDELEMNKVTLPEKKDSGDGKLVIAEEIAEGHVSLKSMKLFLSALAGDRYIIFFTFWLIGVYATEFTNTFQVWFLGYWSSQYIGRPASHVPVLYYLSIYASNFCFAATFYILYNCLWVFGLIRASRTLHRKLIQSVLNATLKWLDKTPTSRIMTRCTQDMNVIDTSLGTTFSAVFELVAVGMTTKLAAVVWFTPIFFFPGLLAGLIGVFIGNIYLRAQISVKREMSNAKAPLLGHFGASINGLVSIRAYSAQAAFRNESLMRINHYVRIARMTYNLNRWIGVRIDFIGDLFTSGLAGYLVYFKNGRVSPANIGFSLNMATEFCFMILWGVRLYNQFEVQANSLERVQSYIDIDHEPVSTESGIPPAAWPTSGELRVEKLSARYSLNGPKVLHDISFHVKSGERIGIVGRTGSGKSSLTLALLRCILTEGDVYYDGLCTNAINLDTLRSNITIIPQVPELLSGTLRRNLDPFEQYDDATLNEALKSSGLFSLNNETGESRLTLDNHVSSGGSNLSVGQRQILALARAMVRGSKLLILDEATSAIDYQTDSIIQSTLRNQLGSDVTIITIAHRLQTIMDADRIMVLDDGRIVELDNPKVLLQKTDGPLKRLVDGSSDREALYQMAGLVRK